jgi:signal transduction histidine kinase
VAWTGVAAFLVALFGAGLLLVPALAQVGEAFLWPAASVATLLLRATGLWRALLFTITVAACRWWETGPDGATLVFGLHPLLLHLLLRRGVALPLALAAIGFAAGLADITWLGITAGALPPIVAGHDVLLSALFGWAAGSLAAAIEASVGPIRHAAVQRYGTLPPVRRLTDVCAGLIALPLAVLLTVTGDYARVSWQAEARLTTMLAAARADEAIASWWSEEVSRFRAVAQRLLDRHYGYFGLPTASDTGEPQWLAAGDAAGGYVATRDGEVLIRTAPDLFVESREIERLRKAVDTVNGPILRDGAEPDTLELVVPLRRDNELQGLAVARYPVSAVLRQLSPLAVSHDTVSLYRLADIRPTMAPAGAVPSRDLLDNVELLLPPGPYTATCLALGSTRLGIVARLPGDWGLRLVRPLRDIVTAGVVEAAWIPAVAACVILLFELAGHLLVKAFIGRLTALPSLPRGWSRRESLADDLAQNLRQRHHEVQLKAAQDSQALARHQAMLASAPVALFTLREQEDGRLVPSYLSPGMQTIAQCTLEDLVSVLGWESLVEADPALTRADAARAHYAVPGQERGERTIRRPDGTERRLYEEVSILSSGAQPFECVGVWFDIEERRQTEEKLLRSMHLMALGEMATSMAHELNQPLNAMRLALANLSKRLRGVELGDETRRFVDERIERLAKQAERASGIVERFRVFGRKAGSDFETALSVSGAVRAATETLAAQLRADSIDLEVSGVSEQMTVTGPPGALEQILVNLIANARDATLDRRARQPSRASPDSVTLRLAASPETVEISVRDSGGGIVPEAMEHLFEPFSTTKPIGKGTGLGLSISYGLAVSMRGELRARNIDRGAEFTLTLPLAR